MNADEINELATDFTRWGRTAVLNVRRGVTKYGTNDGQTWVSGARKG